jgi:hypothetical protein
VLPVRFWQAEQWPTETNRGSPLQFMLSWLQAHVAIRIVFSSDMPVSFLVHEH